MLEVDGEHVPIPEPVIQHFRCVSLVSFVTEGFDTYRGRVGAL